MNILKKGGGGSREKGGGGNEIHAPCACGCYCKYWSCVKNPMMHHSFNLSSVKIHIST